MVRRSRVAVIPARGGSKRIPKKNIVDFHGKPLIAWTIEAALRSGLFDLVVVGTDDPEIAEISRRHGAEVPFMRQHFADEHSPVSLATLGTLQQLREELGQEYDVVVQLMANCPIRDESHIASAVAHFDRRRLNSLISCFKFGWMNPWWAVKLSADDRPTVLFPEFAASRSQDLEALYCPTGATWIARVEALERTRTFHMDDRVFFPMEWEAAVDIDDMEDLRMAECVHLMRRSHR